MRVAESAAKKAAVEAERASMGPQHESCGKNIRITP